MAAAPMTGQAHLHAPDPAAGQMATHGDPNVDDFIAGALLILPEGRTNGTSKRWRFLVGALVLLGA